MHRRSDFAELFVNCLQQRSVTRTSRTFRHAKPPFAGTISGAQIIADASPPNATEPPLAASLRHSSPCVGGGSLRPPAVPPPFRPALGGRAPLRRAGPLGRGTPSDRADIARRHGSTYQEA